MGKYKRAALASKYLTVPRAYKTHNQGLILFSDIRQTNPAKSDGRGRNVPRRGDDQDLAGLELRAMCLPHLAHHSRS